MAYSIQLARTHWQEGQRRVAEAGGELDVAVEAVMDEIRRRLGAFEIHELSDLYAAGTDWADAIAHSAGAGRDTAWVVDAAFWRFSQHSSDFAGGRMRRIEDSEI